MKILALETTELRGSIAILDGDKVLWENALDPNQQSARSLAPAIRRALTDVRWQSDDVELVAVTIGPGSFTGLRLGLATAKAFAYCTHASLLGVGTLETIAAAAPDDVNDLSIAVDAQRGQVVAGEFRRGLHGYFVPVSPSQLLDADVWLSHIPPSVMVSGPALRRYGGSIPQHLRTVPQERWAPMATQAGRLAARDWADGRRDDLWKLSPVYSRRSAAEEKWDQRQSPPEIER